nr:unnamed protein product [Digitaria exilis]
MPQTPSTRWCPTPEQLMILEEMYRSGVRTPNAAEIQQITAHLAYYGRIEGKNVFYWFQNHKARERQRLRRRLCARHQQQAAAAAASPPIPPVAGGSSAGAGAGGNEKQATVGGVEEWDAADTTSCGATASGGSSDEGGAALQLPPCCRRPLKTLDLFPTKSTGGGLKDECSSSKSSSCSTSTN